MDHQNSDSEDSNRIYWDRRGQADGVAGDADLLRYAGGVGADGGAVLPFTQAVCAACSSTDDSSSTDDGSDDGGSCSDDGGEEGGSCGEGDRKPAAEGGGKAGADGEHRTPPPPGSARRRRKRRRKRRAINPLCGEDETPATIGKFRRRRSASPVPPNGGGADASGSATALLSVIDSATKLRISRAGNDGKDGEETGPGRIKLPPLGNNRSKMNLYNSKPSAAPFNAGKAERKAEEVDEMDRYLGSDGEDDGKSGIDLAREIEMTLDEAERRRSADNNGGGAAGVRNGTAAAAGVQHAGLPAANPYAAPAAGAPSDDGGRRGLGIGPSDAHAGPKRGGGPGVIGPPAASAAGAPSAAAAATGASFTAASAPDDEFDDGDEGWDFDAIDLSVAMTQRQRHSASGGGGNLQLERTQMPPRQQRHSYPPGGASVRHVPPPAAPPPPGAGSGAFMPSSYGSDRLSANSLSVASNGPAAAARDVDIAHNSLSQSTNDMDRDDEFFGDDDEEEWDLEAIDRNVLAMTQGRASAAAPADNTIDSTLENNDSAAPEEFSEDDEVRLFSLLSVPFWFPSHRSTFHG